MAGMSEAEKKKYLSKLRKAQKKAEAEAQQQASQSKGKKRNHYAIAVVLIRLSVRWPLQAYNRNL